MSEKFRSPMLATDYDPVKLSLPKLASPKLDGWRGVIHRPEHVSDAVTTRSGKPVRNRYTQALLTKAGLGGLDGEITVGQYNAPNVFNLTDAAMKKFEGEHDVSYWVFDHYLMEGQKYVNRLQAATDQVNEFNRWFALDDRMFRTENGIRVPRVKVLPHKMIYTMDQLAEYEEEQLLLGFEGIMLNDPDGTYKYGRSTMNEAKLLKVKRYRHDEAKIVGFVELMHNDNEAFMDELGRTKRSSHQENKRPSGMIGAYVCENDELWPGVQFNVSCGSMTHAEKRVRLSMAAGDLGEWIRFKHLPHGAKDAPRHGLFAGFRAPEDRTTIA